MQIQTRQGIRAGLKLCSFWKCRLQDVASFILSKVHFPPDCSPNEAAFQVGPQRQAAPSLRHVPKSSLHRLKTKGGWDSGKNMLMDLHEWSQVKVSVKNLILWLCIIRSLRRFWNMVTFLALSLSMCKFHFVWLLFSLFAFVILTNSHVVLLWIETAPERKLIS